jgi:hypothetical protein
MFNPKEHGLFILKWYRSVMNRYDSWRMITDLEPPSAVIHPNQIKILTRSFEFF